MTERLKELISRAEGLKLDRVLVHDQANLRALTGVTCDSACLDIYRNRHGNYAFRLLTDFRYAPMVHRCAPDLKVGDLRKFAPSGLRIGIEFGLSHARFLSLQEAAKDAQFIDLTDELAALRAVKTLEEQSKLRAAEALNDEIWQEAKAKFRVGMTERQMARIIRHLMIDRGNGEAFDTIVCVGANAAECHHEPDDTVWNGREPVLVDMGVRLDGVCSDMTRNIVPKRPRPLYRQVYDLVLAANRAAIAAARPGITGKELDSVARKIIASGGFGRCFGHSLGHGVGYEIHEAPYASQRSKTVLRPGMTVTIEPGVYLEGNLGVRIEDLVLITDSGCEVLSSSAK